MTRRRIALIGYPAEYFLHFSSAMEEAGFEVYWVCALNSDAEFLVKSGVSKSAILNVNEEFRFGSNPLDECRKTLAAYENQEDPKINNIILMDRLLREKEWAFSIEFITHVAISVDDFLTTNGIDLVSSWRDTAVQLVSMLVARKRGIPFVIPTRIRIPQEAYGFCTSHQTDSFIKLKSPTSEDRRWAEEFLRDFETRALRPALKLSSRGFLDVLKLLPSHLWAFRYEVRRSFKDFGNSHTRYTVPSLVYKYLARRLNLLAYKFFSPGEKNPALKKKFCIYALHTQPESSIDVQGAFFSDQIELIRHIARSLPADHLLYVKVHPTDVDGKTLAFFRRIKAIPSVVLVDFSVDSRKLVEHCSIVFSLTGTIAYEGGLKQKPVITFARNFFNGMPTIHYCDSPTSLASLIAKALSEREPADAVREKIITFLTNLRVSCFDGEVARSFSSLTQKLYDSDLRQLQVAYGALCQHFVKEKE